MSFGSEDLSIFLSEFTEECELPGGAKVVVVLDSADELRMSGRMISSEYLITGKTSELFALEERAKIKVAGTEYTVQQPPRRIDDGQMCEVFLSEGW